MRFRQLVLLSIGLCALCSESFAESRTARFQRILKLYTNPKYRCARTHVSGVFAYSGHQNETKPDSRGLSEEHNATTDYLVELTNDFRLNQYRYQGDSAKEMTIEWNLGTDGQYSHESRLESNDLIGKSDTTDYLEKHGRVFFDGGWQFRKYRTKKRPKRKFFYGGDLEAEVYAKHLTWASFEHLQLQGNSIDRWARETDVAVGALRVTPFIGWGRPVQIVPLFTAFEIERTLREDRIISANLSDSTILSLAQLIATRTQRDRLHYQPAKFFSRDIDSVLQTDSSYRHYSPYSAMRMREVTDRDRRLLSCGPRIQINAFEEVILNVRNHSEYNGNGPQVSSTAPLFQNAYSMFDFSLEYGWAITDRLFASCGLAGPLPFLNTSSEEEFSANPLKLRTDANISIAASYWISEKLTLDLTASGLPTKYVIVPSDWPHQLTLSLRYFIDDNIQLRFDFDNIYDKGSLEQTTFEPASSWKRSSQLLGIGITYEL